MACGESARMEGFLQWRKPTVSEKGSVAVVAESLREGAALATLSQCQTCWGFSSLPELLTTNHRQ